MKKLLLLPVVVAVAGCPPKEEAPKPPPATTPAVAPEGLGKAELPPDGSGHGTHGSISRSPIAALPMTEPVAKVNDVTFTRADLERSIAQHAVVAGIPPAAIDAPMRDALEGAAYEKLIERQLLTTEAKKRSLWPSDDDIKKEREKLIATIPPGKTFEEALKAMGTDEKTFMDDIASDVAIGKLFESLKKELPEPKEAELKKIYDENKDKFAVPETSAASHILIKVAKDAPPDEVKKAQEKAEAILKEVKGKDYAVFKKVAKEKSEDPSAKMNEGDLGTFARGDMVPQFEEVAFKLKPGELSGVVRSDFGFHIIRGRGTKKGEQKKFGEVKMMIMQREQMKGFMDKVDGLIDQLRKSAKIERIKEPLPSPFGEDMKGTRVPSWKPQGGNASGSSPHGPSSGPSSMPSGMPSLPPGQQGG